MTISITYIIYIALALAGIIGITLSVPLQAPAVILLGFAAILAACHIVMSEALGRCSASKQRRESVAWSRKGKVSWLVVFSLAAIIYFVVRAWNSPVFDLGVEDLMLILPAAILYIVAGYGMRGERGARLRVGLACVVIVLLILHLGSCVLQWRGGSGYSLSLYLNGATRSSTDHNTGMYGYYGSYANFAIISGLLCLSLGLWGRISLISRGLLFALGLLAMGSALLSQSRSAAVSLVPALAVWGIVVLTSLKEHRNLMKLKGRVILVCVGGGIFTLVVLGGIWVMGSRGVDTSSSEMLFDSDARVKFWPMAAEQWADYPIFGAGSRSFSYECYRYWNPNLGENHANPEFVHNEYLQLLADYGLIGLVLIGSLFAGHFVVGFKQVRLLVGKVGGDGLKRGSNAMALAVAGMSGMTAMAVHICFDFRTHLLANLLLLVCCTVWLLPVLCLRKDDRLEGKKVRDLRIRSLGLPLVLFILGVGAIGLGGQQMWAGMPLIEKKMAKEDGSWVPQAVDREVWIPMLEKSLARVPQWRRYERLGTLYRLNALNSGQHEAGDAIQKSEACYMASIERHPYSPVAKINLASLYADLENYDQAEEIYASVSELALVREPWFRMHTKWAQMNQQWAIKLWHSANFEGAERKFLRSKDLYQLSLKHATGGRWNYLWVKEYTQLLIVYARCLDGQKKYDDAELLYSEARQQRNWYARQKETKLNFYYGQHLYEKGRHMWFQRKPEEAYQLMVKSKEQLIQHKAMMKSGVERGYDQQLSEVDQVIKFFKETGVSK